MFESLKQFLQEVIEKIAKSFPSEPPAPKQECPEEKDKPKIVAVEILDGSDTEILAGSGFQYVNLPGADKWNDADKIKNKDRQTQKPRVKVRFDRPCAESFKIKLEPGGANSVYTATEKGRSSNFKYDDSERTYTTNADGTKIVHDLFFAAGGNDAYKYAAKDNYGNQVKSVELATIRRIFLQELKMQGASAAASVSPLICEFENHRVEIIQLTSQQMDRVENVGEDTSVFETKARTAYTASGCSTKEPYVVAVAYTDHLAVKESPPAITKGSVEVGPGKPVVNIPILVGGASKKLWKNIVTGESWFVSATFRKTDGTAADDVTITADRVTAVASNASVPDSCGSVDVRVDGLTTAVESGTISLTVHIVNRMRGGISLGGGNLICVCTRAWWQTKSDASQNETMAHELGHKVGMVPEGTGSSLDRTTNQYTARGHRGSHCHTGIALQATFSSTTGTTCTMFGATNGVQLFCDECAKAVKKLDLASGWSAF